MRIPKNAKPFFEPLNIKRKAGLNGKLILTIPTVEEVYCFIFHLKSVSDLCVTVTSPYILVYFLRRK